MAPTPLLPSWIHAGHPLYLNQAIRSRIRRKYRPDAIFLNIPYSHHYSRQEVAILSTVTAYGLLPRMARQRGRLEVRLLKILELILSCRYGITDLSYARRMNMPFELGLLLALGKECFVTSQRRFAALREISDLNFTDIYYYGGSLRRLVVGLSQWIEQNYSRERLTTETLIRRYRRLRRIRAELKEDFDRLRPEEVAKLLGVARDESSRLARIR